MLSDLGTTGLWGVWLWLCRPVLGVLGFLRGGWVQHALTHLSTVGASAGAERGLVTLCSACGVIWLWRRLVRHRRGAAVLNHTPNYAIHFGLSDLQLHRFRASQICVVHHDDSGRISAIEPASSASPMVELVDAAVGPNPDRELAVAA